MSDFFYLPKDLFHLSSFIDKTDDNITIVGKLKKEWIETPKQLGSKRLKLKKRKVQRNSNLCKQKKKRKMNKTRKNSEQKLR